MYADRLESEFGTRNMLKDRINSDISIRVRQVTHKRQRQEDKWEHDLFTSDNKPQLSNRRVDAKDLRLKLQKRHHRSQSGSGVGDLREKLSGTMNTQLLKSKVEVLRPSMKSRATETVTETRKSSNQASKKKSQQVDMDALMHMTDDDLKAMLIPMGPRKKIILALGSKC